MRKILLLLSATMMIFVASCKKDGNNPANNLITTTTSYAGNYSGAVTVNVSSTGASILTDHLTTIAYGGSKTVLVLQTNLIQSTSATLTNNVLTIASHTVNSNATFYTIEYGTGTFANNALTFEFHQNIYSTSNNALLGTGEWTGTVTKQ